MHYAGLLKRCFAFILDNIVMVPVIFALSRLDIPDSRLNMMIGAVYLIYSIGMEYKFGQTLGKQLIKIKVVRQDGRPCTLTAAVLRNVGRILDTLLFGYLIAMILISVTKKKQRIGDMIAGTVVIDA